MVTQIYSPTFCLALISYLAVRVVIHSYPITEELSNTTSNDEDIASMFATYENAFINNDNWMKEDLKKSIDFEEPSVNETAEDDWAQTTQTTSEVVNTVQGIIKAAATEDNQKQFNEDVAKERTVIIVVNTNVYSDAASNQKNKEHHTELSFGIDNLLLSKQKTIISDNGQEMHNRITNEFFNDMGDMTKTSGSKGRSTNLDSLPVLRDPNDAFASILDPDIREEFTKEIPGVHHKPAYEEMIEYSPLKDAIAFMVNKEETESIVTSPTTDTSASTVTEYNMQSKQPQDIHRAPVKRDVFQAINHVKDGEFLRILVRNLKLFTGYNYVDLPNRIVSLWLRKNILQSNPNRTSMDMKEYIEHSYFYNTTQVAFVPSELLSGDLVRDTVKLNRLANQPYERVPFSSNLVDIEPETFDDIFQKELSELINIHTISEENLTYHVMQVFLKVTNMQKNNDREAFAPYMSFKGAEQDEVSTLAQSQPFKVTALIEDLEFAAYYCALKQSCGWTGPTFIIWPQDEPNVHRTEQTASPLTKSEEEVEFLQKLVTTDILKQLEGIRGSSTVGPQYAANCNDQNEHQVIKKNGAKLLSAIEMGHITMGDMRENNEKPMEDITNDMAEQMVLISSMGEKVFLRNQAPSSFSAFSLAVVLGVFASLVLGTVLAMRRFRRDVPDAPIKL